MYIHPIITTLALVLIFIFGGCSKDSVDPNNTEEINETSMLNPPTLYQIQNSMELNVSQIALVKYELSHWQLNNERKSDRTQRTETRPRNYPLNSQPTTQIITFVARVSPSLETQQLASLVTYLVSYLGKNMAPTAHTKDGFNKKGIHRSRKPSGQNGNNNGAPFAELGLSINQVQTIRDLRYIQRVEMESLHDQFTQSNLTKEEFHELAQVMRRSNLIQLSEFISEDQLTIMEQIREERQIAILQLKQDNISYRISRQQNCLIHVLELCNDQQNQLKSIFDNSFPKQEAILACILSGEIELDDGRTRLLEIYLEDLSAVQALLSNIQLERLDAILPLFKEVVY